MWKRSKCKLCNEQFLANERRWKLFTIPVFTVITALSLTKYPLEFGELSRDCLYIFTIIIALWLSNRFIIVRFHHKYKHDRNKKKKLILRYLLSILISLLIVIPASNFYHAYCETHHELVGSTDLIISHRMLYLITILFVYFINANYERMFLFIELSEKAVEAEAYKRDSTEAKFKILKDKINPHFLFNTFNALSETIEENPPKASELVLELSDVYRYVLDNQEINWVPVKKEISFAQSYVSLLKMRFEKNLIININIPEEIYEAYITPLTMQILIENAVKHNIISSSQPLKIDISTDNNFIIVSNNLQKKEVFENSASFGLKNLSERYRFLSDKKVLIQETESEFVVKVPIVTKH